MSVDREETELRQFAQQENDYILGMLLRPKQKRTAEDPQKLAERNCDATAECFGKSDFLHAMALNTLAFSHLYKSTGRGNGISVARDAAANAARILRRLEGQEEMLLESQCLAVLAKIKAGKTCASAVLDILQRPVPGENPSNHVQTAGETFGEILVASVFQRRLSRVVLLMVLREIAEGLLTEIEAAGENAESRSLRNSLSNFLQTYFGPANDKE